MGNRITNTMMANNYLRNLNNNLNNMSTLQNQLSTGMKVNRASDNPSGASKIMKINTETAANDQYKTNIKTATNWLDVTDTSLNQLVNVFSRVNKLTVQAGDGAYSDEERASIKNEINELKKTMRDVLNTNYDGSYIFGGTKTLSTPVALDSNGKLAYADANGKAIVDSTVTIQGAASATEISGVTITGNSLKFSVNGTEISSPLTLSGTGTTKEQMVTALQGYMNNDSNYSSMTDKEKEYAANNIYDAYISEKNNAEVPKNSDYLSQIGSKRQIEVSQGVTIDYNITASEILEFNASDQNGKTINVMDIFDKITYALDNPDENITIQNDDGTTTQKTQMEYLENDLLTDLNSISQNLLTKRSEVGAMQNRMENALSNNEDQNYNLTEVLSNVQDIDYAETMMNYSVLQTVYTAALQTGSSILTKTIMDYI